MDPGERRDELDALLQHAGYLRRLARSLLGGDGYEDDVVQQAWLAALTRPRGSIRAPRSWLAAAVRQISWRRRRERSRRESRERRAAVAETDHGATADDGEARVAALRRVLDVVSNLRDPYRDAILRRYFDDQSFTAIAAARGVSEATARTWVHRGLKELRARLDPPHADARRAFLVALAPTAGFSLAGAQAAAIGSAAALTGGGSPWPIIGWWLMKSKNVLTMLMVLAASIGIGVWQWSAREPDPLAAIVVREPTAADRAATPPDPSPIEEPGAAERRVQAADPVAALADWTVLGSCHAADGRAIAGVPVRLRRLAGLVGLSTPAEEVQLLAEILVHSGEDGAFSWPQPTPAGPCTVEAIADPTAGWYCQRQLHFVVEGSAAPRFDLTVYPLDGRLTGSVLDEQSAPIASAVMVASDQRATTDAQGRFELPVPAAIGLRRVVTYADGFAMRMTTLEFPGSGQRRELEIRLVRELRVTGTVRDAAGQPIVAARIHDLMNPTAVATTDEQGRYTLGHLDPGDAFHLITAYKPGLLADSSAVDQGVDPLHCDFVLGAGVTVSGRVTDADGHPLPGVRLAFQEREGHDTFSCATDGAGAFECRVSPGELDLTSRLAGFAPDLRRIDVPAAASVFAPLDIVLGRGHFVGGRVIDDLGSPVANAELWFECGMNRGVGEKVRTDATGRFRAEGLPDGRLTVLISGPDHASTSQPVAPLDVEYHEFTLPRSGAIVGQVVDGRSGTPIPAFRIRLVDATLRDGEAGPNFLSAAWWDEGYEFHDEQGRFSTRPHRIQLGAICALQAIVPGYAPTTVDRIVAGVDPEREPVLLRMYPPLILRGRVVDAQTDAPLRDAVVRRHQEEDVLRFSTPNDVNPTVRTDPEGRFELPVTAGPIGLRIDLPDGRIHLEDPVDMPADGVLPEQLIRVGNFGSIAGRLLDAAGQPLADEVIHTMHFGPGGYAEDGTDTDAGGAFTFADLTAGDYFVSHVVRADGQELNTFTVQVRVRNGAVSTVTLQPNGSAAIGGTIRCDHHAIPALLRVAAAPRAAQTDADGATLRGRAVFARDGRFHIDGLAAGVWQIEVYDSHDDVAWVANAEVDVVDGQTTMLSLELKRE